jgi:hypothetical protein
MEEGMGRRKGEKEVGRCKQPLFEHSLVVVIIAITYWKCGAVDACEVGWGGLGDRGCVTPCHLMEMTRGKRLAQYGCRA